MDGLEAVEVDFSQVFSSTSTFRYDSEYFQKQFLADEESLSDKFTKFDDLGVKVDASAFYPSIEPFYGMGNLPFLRVADVDNTIDYEGAEVIPEELTRINPTLNTVEKGDVLLTKGGSIARVGLSNRRAAVSRDLIFINSSKLKERDYNFLSIYLGTDFANRLLMRSGSQSVQAHLTTTLVRETHIFWSNEDFREIAFQIKVLSLKYLEHSKQTYARAESLLLERLNLANYIPTQNNSSSHSFSSAFGAAGRLDAEFFEPKYFEMLEAIEALEPEQMVPLGDLLSVVTNGQTPLHHDLSEGTVRFLTAEHVSDFRINFDSKKRVLLEHHEGQLRRTRVTVGDLLLTIKGRVGNMAIVEDVPFETNINQDVALLRLKDGYHPYYIAGYINSLAGKMLVEQISTGQINPFLGLGSLRTIPIPIFSKPYMNEIGEQIKAKIHEAQAASQTSSALLELAKRGVEKAIEDGEEVATAWLEGELEKLGVKLDANK